MKQDMKVCLKEVFAAPKPEKKDSFLRKARTAQVSTFDFVKSQLFYIRKRVWILSLLILVAALAAIRFMEINRLWIISAFIPFIALCAVLEGTRSVSYGMSELEMSARFSLKSITLARMVSIGLVHLGIIGVLIPLSGGSELFPMVKEAVYLLVPYLLTAVLGLIAVRELQDYQSSYVCTGCAVIVSSLGVYIRSFLSWVYEEKHFIWWCVFALYLLGRGYKEYQRMIYQTEDFVWN